MRLDFAKLYLQLGIRYPHKYIEAWVDQTRGYWNGGYSYWIWATEVYENPLGIQKTVKCHLLTMLSKIFIFVETITFFTSIYKYRALCLGNLNCFLSDE